MLASRIQLGTHQITNYIQNKRFYRFRRGLKYNHFLPQKLCDQHLQSTDELPRCQTCSLREEYPPVPLSTVRYLLYSFNRLPVSLDTIMLEQLVDVTIQPTTNKLTNNNINNNNNNIDNNNNNTIMRSNARKKTITHKRGLKSIYNRLKNKFTNGVTNTPFRFHPHKEQQQQPLARRKSGGRLERLLQLRGLPAYQHPSIRYSNKRTTSSSISLSSLSTSSLLSSNEDYLQPSRTTMATTATTHSTNVFNILFSTPSSPPN
ncbi:hypothetical protein, no similarity [Maudiozyma saulgeensis]|uniref:Uncharacterized protein n=1 Tax=Maudiozyma saulgeensis TaxID=1789683 RepID=A0A1X7R8F5_9SACH|nr:hypothetical protein, no similarity [Kazachstania saulgeensis]